MEQFLHYLTLPYLLGGCLVVVALMVLSLAGGLVVGLGLALASESSSPLLRYPVRIYIYLVRGTPQLMQLILIFNVLPETGLFLSPFASALLALTINETAFCAEIIRGGIGEVSRDQRLAAMAFGFSRTTLLLTITLPQAFRSIIPTLGNEAIGLLKSTSLASVVGVGELTLRSQTIVSQNFEFLPVLLASSAMYIVMSTVLAFGQRWLERRFSLAQKAERNASGVAQAASGAAGDGEPSRLPDLASIASDGPGTPRSREPSPLLVFDAVEVAYQSTAVIKGVDLTIGQGEVVALLGRSGSGKSTLLKSVLALTDIAAGRISVQGRPIAVSATGAALPARKLAQSRAAAEVGMVFQNFALFEHMTALENAMSVPRYVQKLPPNECSHRAHVALMQVGLHRFAHRMHHELSGGQQQRVGIARALAGAPKVLLFDEPTSALDPELVGEVNQTIRALAKTGITMLLSTHDIGFAASVADRIVFLHDGKVLEQGGPDILRAPVSPEFASFLRLAAVSPEPAVPKPSGIASRLVSVP